MPSRAIALAGLLALWSGAASAQSASAIRPSPWGFGLTAAGGTMVTNDQRDALAFDGGGGLLRAELRARPLDELGVDWLETDVRAGFLVVGPGQDGNVGGVLDFGLGVRAAPRVGDVRPYVSVAFGVALTGPLVRPVGTAALGVAFLLGDEVTLGPEVGLQHVLQNDGDGQSDDAVFLSLGAALTYRPVPHPPSPPPDPEIVVVTEERVRVVRDPTPPFTLPPVTPVHPAAMDELFVMMNEAACGPAPEPATTTVTLLPPVLFDHDESEITAAGEVAMHDVLARIAESPRSARIVVEGHADVTGTSDYNEALALARAQAVVEWLAAHGIEPEALEATGHGDRRPLVAGETPEDLAPNRRVTIRIEVPPEEAP